MKALHLTPIFLDIETTGLNPLEHEIVAIGIKTLIPEIPEDQELLDSGIIELKWATRVEIRGEKTEAELINKALILLREYNCIIGYNITGFDIPFLSARLLANGFDGWTVAKLRKQYRIDLMHIVTRYLLTNNRHVKLADIAAFLGIDVDDEITGKDIPELYERGEFEKIANHCRSDLEVITALFVKLKDLCIHNLQRRYDIDCEVLLEGVESL